MRREPKIDHPEIVLTSDARVCCDGQGGALGHPRVWYSIPRDAGFVECRYCDRRFILRGGPADQSAA